MELRRFIFGLCAIIGTAEAQLPQIINQQLPGIVNYLTSLSKKMLSRRLQVLKEKENHLKKGKAVNWEALAGGRLHNLADFIFSHEDFEYNGDADATLYVSRIRGCDELKTCQETLI